MSDNRLFASVVLLRELYDNDKDIFDILSQFIRSALLLSKEWTFDVTRVGRLLYEHFEFRIPDAVLKTCIRKRLLKDGTVTRDNGMYVLHPDEFTVGDALDRDLCSAKTTYSAIVQRLTRYIEGKRGYKGNEQESARFERALHDFLLDNSVEGKYAPYVSAFVIENASDSEFAECIASIREGLLIYNGVVYSADLNEVSAWKAPLSLYLGTETLFTAGGLNGQIFSAIFSDFLQLVREANQNNAQKAKGDLIKLRYFEDAKREVDDFFYAAECILEGKAYLDPSKTAMRTILNGCNSKSDVLAKKSKFYNDLGRMQIQEERSQSVTGFPQFNLVDPDTIGKVIELSKDSGHELPEEECRHILEVFSRINHKRQGRNGVGFEGIGHIFLSANGTFHFVARQLFVKDNPYDIPFATDVEFVTNRLWFKLQKGFSRSTVLPTSFDAVTKAKVVLASQLNSCLSDKFEELKRSVETGHTDRNTAVMLHHELRSKSRKPEEITEEFVREAFLVIPEGSFESYLREKSQLEVEAQEGRKAIRELKDRDFLARRKKVERLKGFARALRGGLVILFFTVVVGILLLGVMLLVGTTGAHDTSLNLVGAILTFLLGTIPLIRTEWYLRWTRSAVRALYRRWLRRLDG